MKLSNRVNLQTNVADGQFLPTDLSGLIYWFPKGRVLNSAGNACSDGQEVYTWEDYSGGSRNGTGAADRFTFTTTTNTVRGVGSNIMNVVQYDFENDFTMYAKVYFESITAGVADILFNDATDAGNDDFFRVQSATQLRAKIGGGSAMNYTCSTIATTKFFNIGFERTSGKCQAYLNGVAQDSEISNTNIFSVDRVLGAFDGLAKEIIATNSTITTTERASLNTYLDNL